jgi:enoyl-CoA hydratase/carnithine racemase
MSYEQITFEQRGSAGVLTLNRPEKLNAWTPQMSAELQDAMRRCEEEASIGAIVITGAGRAFCAGADISTFKATVEAMDRGEGNASASETRAVENWVTFCHNLKKPTIGAVNGVAVGIGVTLALPLDIRIASESARFGMFFVKMGLVPELASSRFLPQMVGVTRALEWCLTGRMIPATEAAQAGLISEAVPEGTLLDRALALADQLSKNSAPAMTSIRQLIHQGVADGDIPGIMKREGKALNDLRATWEHREAIAAFFEKRDPDFTRRPAGA